MNTIIFSLFSFLNVILQNVTFVVKTCIDIILYVLYIIYVNIKFFALHPSLKLNFTSIHTNYIISHCTTL